MTIGMIEKPLQRIKISFIFLLTLIFMSVVQLPVYAAASNPLIPEETLQLLPPELQALLNAESENNSDEQADEFAISMANWGLISTLAIITAGLITIGAILYSTGTAFSGDLVLIATAVIFSERSRIEILMCVLCCRLLLGRNLE